MEKTSIDILWVAFAALLVFLMQAGFLCLESGLTRSKNSINVALKNLADFGVAIVLFWTVGFAMMFGETFGGWIGTSGFMPGSEIVGAWYWAFFLYQMMFCGAAVTILSGAVAERMRFSGYLMVASMVTVLIYPIFGHWAWNGLGEGIRTGWLRAQGFVDFAGSTVVHSIGGWVGLAAIIVIGARTGRFPEGQPPQKIPGSNLPVAMLGVWPAVGGLVRLQWRQHSGLERSGPCSDRKHGAGGRGWNYGLPGAELVADQAWRG